jgi:hypothetical protein
MLAGEIETRFRWLLDAYLLGQASTSTGTGEN